MDDIGQLYEQVGTDPRGPFVELAGALRREGRLAEAESVLVDGLAECPDRDAARIMLARVLADTGRTADAVQILDEMYPRHATDTSLVEFYLWSLVAVARYDDVLTLLDRALLLGVSESVCDEIRSLVPERTAEEPVIADPIGPPASPAAAADKGEGGRNGSSNLDVFACVAVAVRLENVGRLASALSVWEQIASQWPDRQDIAARVADLQFRIESGAETLQGELLALESLSPVSAEMRPALLRWRAALRGLV